jgi:hypothetical protein
MAGVDRRFIEDNGLIERYLEGTLPRKGARELEDWCRANPEYLAELKLAERARLSLALLEASGGSQDLRDPLPPWWKTTTFVALLAALTVMALAGLWVLYGKYSLLRGERDDAIAKMNAGTLAPPAAHHILRVSPDRAAAVDQARVPINHAMPQMLELHIDMGYVKIPQFRVTVDKMDQGRVLVMDNMLRDSNGDLRVSFNTSALTPGRYDLRIEALPLLGTPMAVGWLILDVR